MSEKKKPEGKSERLGLARQTMMTSPHGREWFMDVVLAGGLLESVEGDTIEDTWLNAGAQRMAKAIFDEMQAFHPVQVGMMLNEHFARLYEAMEEREGEEVGVPDPGVRQKGRPE